MQIIGVTNRKLCKDFYGRIRKIAKDNKLQYLILREKDLSNEELFNMAILVKDILNKSNIKLIINNNIEVAKKANAEGVQLSFKYFCDNGKEYNEGIVGVSIHSLEEAVKAESLGANYLLYGHVFETDCKKGLKPRGLDELREINKIVKIPVYAIGGINSKNCREVLESGVAGIAIMSSLMERVEGRR